MNPLLSFSRRLLVLAALVLAGCSAMRVVDSDVQTFSPWQGASGAPGTTYNFRAKATDSLGASSGWVVIGPYTTSNRPPGVPTLTASVTSALIGDTITLNFSTSDPDGNLDYTNLIFVGPAGLVPQRGLILLNNSVSGGSITPDRNKSATALGYAGAASRTFTLPVTVNAVGTYSFRLAAFDSSGAQTDSADVTVTVAQRAPTLVRNGTWPATVWAGNPLNLSYTANDPDASPYAITDTRFTVQGVPYAVAARANVKTATQTMSIAAAVSGATYTIVASATDGGGLIATDTHTVTVVEPPPAPTASLSASPASGSAPLAADIVWTTTNATTVSVSGTGVSSGALNGSASVSLAAGTHTFTVTATGAGGTVTATKLITVSAVTLYRLTLNVSPAGAGALSGAGLYTAHTSASYGVAANSGFVFANWQDDVGGTSTTASGSVLMSRDRTWTANFSAKPANVITFASIADYVLPYPGGTSRDLGLVASTLSGQPVILTIVSGPATVAGATLTLNGAPGTVTVRASQPTETSAYRAATAVDRTFTVTVAAPPQSLLILESSKSLRRDKSTEGTGKQYISEKP